MHRIKLLFLWAVPCPDWLKARASRTFWKTLSQPLMRHSTSPPSHSEGLQRIPRDLRWFKVMRNSLRGRSRPWLMMNDRSPGPLEPRAVATPFPDWHSGPESTQQGPEGSLFGPWGTLAGTFDPPFGPWLRDLPASMPGPWCQPEMRLPGIVVRSNILSCNSASKFAIGGSSWLLLSLCELVGGWVVVVRLSFMFQDCHCVSCRIWKTWCGKLATSPTLTHTRIAEMKGKLACLKLKKLMLTVRPQDLQVQRYSWRQYKPQRESREYFTERSVKYSRLPETRNLGSESPLVQGCTVATQI